MSFLNELSKQINEQFSAGETTPVDVEQVKNNLGRGFDRSARRSYTEEGYLKTDAYNSNPKQLEILMQQPNATVLIKKRMFSSIAENFRPDFMDKDEKMYYKAIKVLFQNKCKLISALERLSKIQKITTGLGNVNDQLIPIISTLSDVLNTQANAGPSSPIKDDAQKLGQIIDKVRRLHGFNQTSTLTNWITDNTNLFQSKFGQGTGVIELTNFTNFSTNTSVDSIKSPGSFNLSLVDPYSCMLITEWDIEKAISDATNLFYNHSIFNFGKESIEEIINNYQHTLNIVRNDRGASPISIKINPSTLLYKKVVAIIDKTGQEIAFNYNPGFGGIGSGVEVESEYLVNGVLLGYNGLDTKATRIINKVDNVFTTDSELEIFRNLVSSIYNKIQLDSNSKNSFQVGNQNTNYTRRKMRFNFLGRLIVQPMDIAYIYIDSKSRYDEKIFSGMKNTFNVLNTLQSLNNSIENFSNSFTSIFSPQNDTSFQIEKSALVGADFPNYLWSLLRPQFTAEKEGISVFVGIVENPSISDDEGKMVVNISGKDNTAYFDQGKINFKPGVDAFNGAIFDPLTPFKTNFDTINNNSNDNIPQLLDENIALLGNSDDKRGLLKFKLGSQAGKKVTVDNFIVNSTFDSTNNSISNIFYAPDGLVYKWKEGIGVYVQFGNSLELNDPSRVGNPSITKEPFAGQDVMNVLSLLITGQPYNYSNYWHATQNIDGFGRDPQSQQDAAYSYTESLRNGLVKNNLLWGNFIAFKNLVINEEMFAAAMRSQFRIIQRNKDLDAKIAKLEDLNRISTTLGAVNTLSETAKNFNPNFLKIKAEAINLQTDIQKTIDAIQGEDATFNALANSSGTDASFDFTDFIDSSKVNLSASDSNVRKSLRRQVNFLTRRFSYNVRANQDKNLFIVDDFYDKDYDILAYEKSLADGISLYNSDFTSTREKIINTADLLNLEVFADTQGHIRVRPPQYNRMPSSVFYKMLHLKQAYGIQIFPQFLSDLFTNQIDTLRKRVEVIEDLIRLDCAILNHNDDTSALQFIIANGANDNSGASFSFISDSTGAITDINQLIESANENQDDNNLQSLSSLIESQANFSKTVFTNSQRYSTIITALTAQNQNIDGFSIQNVAQLEANSYVDQLISRIQTKSGQFINKKDYISNDGNSFKEVVLPVSQVIDIFKVTKELQDKLQERQRVIKLFYSTIKNSIEFRSLDDKDSITGNQMLTPGIFGNSNVPEIFEHMIEDETFDDYGKGSGSRYIIKRSQIKNFQMTENSPDFTMVEVQGILDPYVPNGPEGLNSFPNNGNGMVTAVAVDYDAWRNYGFKNAAPIRVPFLNDANSQCAPYATMVLSRNRKNILRATATLSGNEFLQPGEVVYVEHLQLLFYVNSVRHNFSFGSSFTTTLDLTYGHPAGEYIPTTLDVVGKVIYNNRDIAGYTIQRQNSSKNESSLGVILSSPTATLSGQSNNFDSSNTQTLNNILYTTSHIINANNTKGNNILAKVELRIYHDNVNTIDANLQTFAESVKGILTGKTESFSKLGNGQKISNPTFSDKSVEIVSINLDNDNDRRSPSQKAIDAARNYDDYSGSIALANPETANDFTVPSNVSKDNIRKALFRYIIDCWLSFDQQTVS